MHGPAPSRLAGMDGLRAIAAASVLVYHVWLYALGGDTDRDVVDTAARHLASGVLLFFTLSGLLLYRPFAGALAGERRFPRIGEFGRNRLLRIVPAYWVVLLAAGVVLGVAAIPGAPTAATTGSLVGHPGTLLADLLLVQGYSPSTLLTGLGPAWTLTVELAFYVALPLVSRLALRLARRRGSSVLPFVPPVVFLLAGVVGKLATSAALDGGDPWGRTWAGVLARSLLANADLFAGGMSVAALVALEEAGRLRLPRWWSRAAALAALLLGGAALAVPDGMLGVFAYDSLVALATSCAVSLLVLDGARRWQRARRILERRPLVAVGLASYSVYLWHQPVIDWFTARGAFPVTGAAGLAGATALVALVTGALSTATYAGIERPMLRRKRRAPEPAPAVVIDLRDTIDLTDAPAPSTTPTI